MDEEIANEEFTFLIGERVTLRAMGPQDLGMLAVSFNHPETRHMLFEALPQSEEQIREKITAWERDPGTIMLTICEKGPGRPVGYTGLVRIDWVGRMATFFIAIAEPEDWSKGFGGEATRLLVDYAFDTLNLQRVQLHVWAKNERAVKAYQRAGFEVEGRLRRAMFHAGEYEDFLLMAKLRT